MQSLERILGMWPDRIEKLEGGFFNDVWKVRVGKRVFVARRAKREEWVDYEKAVEVARKTFEKGVAPRVMGVEKKMMVVECADIALLMVIATIRYKLAHEVQGEMLFKQEMENILDSNAELPSPIVIPFGNNAAKARQLGATFALGAALKKTSLMGYG